MDFEIKIIHVLVHMYYFINLYLETYFMEKKIRDYAVYCKEQKENYYFTVNDLTNNDSDEQAVKTNEVIEEAEKVEVTELDDDALSLIDELQKELDVNSLEENPIENDTDYLTMDDLDDEIRVEIEPTFTKYASATISDGLLGPQQWVASIIGMEDTYIHISDGKRIWVNVGKFASRLSIGDLLILDVERLGPRDVKLIRLFKLENNVSSDYIIPDEHYEMYRNSAI